MQSSTKHARTWALTAKNVLRFFGWLLFIRFDFSCSDVRRTNTEFIKMGAQGVSVLVCSGDSGAHGRTDYACNAKEARPDFPATRYCVVFLCLLRLSDVSGAVPMSRLLAAHKFRTQLRCPTHLSCVCLFARRSNNVVI